MSVELTLIKLRGKVSTLEVSSFRGFKAGIVNRTLEKVNE